MSSCSKILQPTPDNLDACARLLSADRLVSVPTETVYGLAGNALRETSIRQIFEVKGRPLIDPLIAHVTDLQAAVPYVKVNSLAEKLAAAFWPGPLTMVLPKQASVPDLLTAGLPSLALRSPRHPVFRALLERLDFPLAAPSANPFNYISPTRAQHVDRTLGSKIAAVLDGGPCEYGIESTIVDLRDPEHPAVLRLGPLSPEEIGKAMNRVIPHRHAPASSEAQVAPGSLTKHYSPKTQLDLLAYGKPQTAEHMHSQGRKCALILNRRPKQSSGPHEKDTFWLSEQGDLAEIASNLYDLLQRVDQMDYQHIFVEMAPDAGIGRSINDRLARAAAKA